jgi:hypothetical protein
METTATNLSRRPQFMELALETQPLRRLHANGTGGTRTIPQPLFAHHQHHKFDFRTQVPGSQAMGSECGSPGVASCTKSKEFAAIKLRAGQGLVALHSFKQLMTLWKHSLDPFYLATFELMACWVHLPEIQILSFIDCNQKTNHHEHRSS